MAKIIISGVIGFEFYGDDLRGQLEAAKGEDVLIEIHSPGGFVWSGLEIFNLIKDYKGKTEVRIMGLAASMAAVISMAADKVTAHPMSVFMIHNARNFTAGDHNEMRKNADFLEKLSDLSAIEFSRKTNKPISEIKRMMDEETFLFGEEMVEAGFVDELIQSEKEANDDRIISIDGPDTMTPEERNKMERETALHQAKNKINESDGMLKDASSYDSSEKAVALMGKLGSELNSSSENKGNNNSPKNKNNSIINTDEIKNNLSSPAKAGTNKTEGKPMPTLEEILAGNAEAKAAYDAGMAAAKKAGGDEAVNKIKQATEFITNENYGKSIKALALRVIKNEVSLDSLISAAAAVDEMKETNKSKQAANETEEAGETKPETETGKPEFDGTVNSAEDLGEAVKSFKKFSGME